MRGKPATVRSSLWLWAGLVTAGIAVVTIVAASPGPAAPQIRTRAEQCSAALSRCLGSLHLMNYFPSGAGWQYMWTRWDHDQINRDFTTMAAMGANSVRITVFPGVTGFPVPCSLMQSQAHYYQVVEQATLSLGLGDAAPWTMYDFSRTAIPGQQQPDQYAFGLLHEDGTPKPAAAVIRQLFRSGKVGDGFNNGFSQAVTTSQGELPAVWRRWEPGQAHFALDPVVGHDAPGSARVSDSGGSEAGVPAFYAVPVQPRIVPGDRYRVTAWVRGRRATGTTVVNISWFNSHGVFMSGSDSASLGAGDTDWTELEATGAAPPGAAFAEIWLKSARNSGTVWFDDVTWTD
jgi:hypothetical protein